MDFDETRLYYSHQQLHQQATTGSSSSINGDHDVIDDDRDIAVALDEDDDRVPLQAARRHFREFLRNYRLGPHRYLYREKLLRMHRRLLASDATWRAAGGAGILDADLDDWWVQQQQQQLPSDQLHQQHAAAFTAAAERARNANHAKLEVDLAHIGEYDPSLLGYVRHQPAAILPALEMAAQDALRTLLYDLRQRRSSAAPTTLEPNYDNMDPYASQEQDVGTSLPGMGGQNNARTTVDDDDPERFLAGIHIQILLKGHLQETPLRLIKSEHMNRLLRCPGIVISTAPVKPRAVRLTVRCHRCLDTRTLVSTDGPFGSFVFPPFCPNMRAAVTQGNPDNDAARNNNNNSSECPRFPYVAVPDESLFVDQQTLKLQEAPERVPTGEMPRSVLLVVERSLVDLAPPGTRVSVLCIPTLFQSGGSNSTSKRGSNNHSNNNNNNTKSLYLRVVGLVKDHDAHGQTLAFSPAEEEAFIALARSGKVYDILCDSLAPSISGSYTYDIKKALICQLMGGSRKKLPDGVRLRGDINVLLLGDPSTAKSQMLKFVSRVAPVGIYTSGKGSSAAGLTASVVRDAKGEFYLEGGAMVLADGGIVCIDEFDKMRPTDRVAIHEAMEQQTISVAKAGITTVLNSRASVLAAANPVFGRYDDFRTAAENIDLMSTILSRFDLVFLVRDVREEERDRLICQHVMGVHIHSSRSADSGVGHHNTSAARNKDPGAFSYMAGNAGMPGDEMEHGDNDVDSPANSPEAIAENVMRVANAGHGDLGIPAMKKYVQYCKAKCAPRLSEEAGQVLTSSYVKIRDDVRRQGMDAAGQQAAIPITVRQLEALVRISESLAKMRLDSEVRAEDVTEALRLFRVSTMAANSVDQSLGNETTTNGVVAASNRDEMDRTESFLHSRLVMGSLVNKQRLVEEAAGQGYNAVIVTRALSIMAARGEILERNQGRLLKRIK